MVEVKIPAVGESVSEGLLVEWSKQDGATVAMDEPLLELETDKVTMTVSAPAAGVLRIVVEAGEVVTVGQVVGRIEPSAAAAATASPAPAEAAPEPSPGAASPAPASDDVAGLAPAVARLVREHDLDPAAIAATGRGGRLTKGDVLAHLERVEPAAEAESRTPDGPSPAAPTPAPTSPAPSAKTHPDQRQTRSAMSPLRRRIAERLVQVQQTAAILTTFNEVDLSRVIALRQAWRERFSERHGVDLGFMSFFLKASIDALKAHPQVNAFIDGEAIVTNHFYDIGVAVSSDKGLVVPVIRDADTLSMAGLETAVADLARRARERTLELGDLTGAVFTISNGGVFGSMLSTPILNPPGSAILGMHAITKRPVVRDDQVVIRPIMYLALSYDHRLIDGREAVTFLKRIVDTLENPERLLLEV